MSEEFLLPVKEIPFRKCDPQGVETAFSLFRDIRVVPTNMKIPPPARRRKEGIFLIDAKG
jgi:hypothetical protein